MIGMKKTFAFIAVLSSVCITSKFSYSAQYWDVTYGGYYDDFVTAIQQTTDGGYIVAGYTESFDTFFKDLWILKLDEDGNVIWQKTYGGGSADNAFSVNQTSDGGYVVAGSTATYGAGYDDIWVLKLDSSGNITWQKAYGGSDQDEAYSIQQTADGGYVVAGYTQSFDTAYYPDDIWVLEKLDGNGNILLAKDIQWDSYERAYSIQQTSDGGYIVAGETMSFGAGVTEDMLVLKLDASGNVSWQKTYGELWEQGANDIQQTIDGGYILAGYHRSGGET